MYSRAMEIVKLKEIDMESVQNYEDKELISDWAFEEVRKTLGSGVFYGRTPDTIEAKANFTFGEAATSIRNLLIKSGLINK